MAKLEILVAEIEFLLTFAFIHTRKRELQLGDTRGLLLAVLFSDSTLLDSLRVT